MKRLTCTRPDKLKGRKENRKYLQDVGDSRRRRVIYVFVSDV